MIDDPLSPVDIRIGTEKDREAIVAFALSLAEDPVNSRDKWMSLMEQDDVYPLLAVYKENIVGQIEAKVNGKIGWLEHARVRLDFRQMGIAHTLVDAAMDWLIGQGVQEVRSAVDSDNIAARRIVEKHHFSPQFLVINPNTEITEDDADPSSTSEVAPVLDESLYNHFQKKTSIIGGNIMVDGQYVLFNQELFDHLVEDRRVYTNYDQTMMLVLSNHQLPSEMYGFLVAETKEEYQLGGKVLKGFAAREMATLAICHAPARRDPMLGLAHAEYGWNQPHSLIIYRRDSWQERE